MQTKKRCKVTFTEQKMKFSIKNFFGKCDQICNFLQIWSHLMKKSLMENFIFCAVLILKILKAQTQKNPTSNLIKLLSK